MVDPTDALRGDGPRAQRSDQPAETGPQAAGERTAASVAAGLVLLVDDERIIVRIGKTALERAGFQVVTASDGVAALDLLEHLGDQLCALVLDVALPQLAGTAILERLAVERPGLPVLIATGLDDPAVDAAVGGGFRRALLSKPYLPSELVASVRALLGADAHGRERR